MNNRAISIILATTFAGLAMAAGRTNNFGGGSGGFGSRSGPSAAPNSNSGTESYNVIYEHNIFLKDRRAPQSRPSFGGGFGGNNPGQWRTPSNPDRNLYLTGVALDDDGVVRAYVESSESTSILRLSVGDRVGRGTLTAIDLTGVEYTQSGYASWIEIGRDFAGGVRSTIIVETEQTPTSAGTVPTSLPADLNPNDPNLTVEQRMKLRRMQGK